LAAAVQQAGTEVMLLRRTGARAGMRQISVFLRGLHLS
jgi:hypothetical protein